MPPTENMCPCHRLPNFVAIHLKHAQELWCTKLRADAKTSHTLTHTHASLIYYSFLWPKSVTSCVTESSYTHIQQCIHRDTHTQHRYMYHVPFQQRGRVNGVFFYDETASLLIVPFWSWNHNVWMDVKLSSRSAPGSHHRPSMGRKSQPCWTYNLTSMNLQTSPEGFGSRSVELHTATKSCSPEVLMYRGVAPLRM